MDVHLLIYDLSRGLARQMSMGLLGFQLDAIYHTSIQLQDREYVYDGGIVSIVPGSSHLGQPMEKLRLGTTNLPMDVIEEYLESVRSIFTLEAYDLFRHNCNNFTDSFANFLLGKGIPSYIANMPQAVMDSPMGRMLLPQLTQGVNASRQNGSILGLQQASQAAPSLTGPQTSRQAVHLPKNVSEFDRLLDSAKDGCAAVFFTSATCGPCRQYYPIFDQMAEELGGKATLIKIDISQPAFTSISKRYEVRATPTFITFLKGTEEERWSGEGPATLRSRLQLLVHAAFPRHPHESLRLPTISSPDQKPVLYAKVPPMEKLLAKMGEPVSSQRTVQSVRAYIENREREGMGNTLLPDLADLAGLVQSSATVLPPGTLFGIVDLFRCVLADPRASAHFIEEPARPTILAILHLVNTTPTCPYALRLVTLQMACNLASSAPLFADQALADPALRRPLTSLISSSFLDESHNSVRVAASSLLLNIALAAGWRRRAGHGVVLIPEEEQVELGASVVEAISQEEQSGEALHGMLLALGHLVYRAPLDGELADLMRALEARDAVVKKKERFGSEKLVREVGEELLGKGLRLP